jgi:hypothetical protein
MRLVFGCVALFCLAIPAVEAAREDKVFTPAEAIKMVDKEVTVQMVVRSSKNALAKRHEIYLDSASTIPPNIFAAKPSASPAP